MLRSTIILLNHLNLAIMYATSPHLYSNMHSVQNAYSLLILLFLLLSHGFGNPLVKVGLLGNHDKIKVSTYNLWNVMFNWEIRIYRIVQMVRPPYASFFMYFLIVH